MISWQAEPYALPLIVVAAVVLFVAVYSWRRLFTPQVRLLSIMMGAVAVWLAGYALVLLSDNPTGRVFWSNVRTTGAFAAQLSGLILIFYCTGYGWLLKKPLAWLVLFALPVITVPTLWIGPLQSLYYGTSAGAAIGQGSFSVRMGPLFWADLIYGLGLLIVNVIVLARAYHGATGLYRQQILFLLMWVLLPWVGQVLGPLELVPPGLNLTPFAAALAGLLIAWGMFRRGLFGIVPLARGAIVTGMGDSVFVIDADNGVVDLNPAARQLLGRPASATIGRPMEEVLASWPDLLACCRSATATSAELVRGTGDAQRFYDAQVSSLTDRRGRPLGRLIVLRDITRREQAEEALRASESRYRLLADNVTDFIWAADTDGRLTYVSPSVTFFSGFSLEEVLALPLSEIFSPPTPDVIMAGDEVVEGGSSSQLQYELEFRRKDGSIVWAEVRASMLRGPDGRPSGVVGVTRDITERKQAEKALRRYAAELQARNEELDSFAYSVAHDLQNPLSLIIMLAEHLVEDRDCIPENQRQQLLQKIAQDGRKMNNIIKELLLLASVREMDVKLWPLDMASVVAEAQRRLEDTIQETQAQIVGPATWPGALGHPLWVEEVWFNYLSNALRYGGCPPRVELGFDLNARPDGAEAQTNNIVRFWVRDRGPGIAPEEQAHLFTPFMQLKQVRATGFGLGLSIVRRIVEKLGGQVGVESSGVPGEGSLFYFTLPVEDPRQGAAD
jgi:PAS domain S-box-containing protein